MKEAPPKVLALAPEEAQTLLQRLQEGTATAEEREEMITILRSYREIMHFIKHADKSWDNHVLEIDHEWRKKKNLNKLK